MSIQIEIKPLSSLEKIFPDEDLSLHPCHDRFVMLNNERLSYQIGIYAPPQKLRRPAYLTIKTEGALAPYTHIRQVRNVGVNYPISPANEDTDYLRTTPSLYPDPIAPLCYNGQLRCASDFAQAIWLDVELPDAFPGGDYVTTVSFFERNDKDNTETYLTKAEIHIRVLAATLPRQKTIHTEWFYSDCIAEEYRVKPFSKKHWEYLKNYIEVAAKNGINMILTPVFTPELDTYIGGYRLTTQLVSITVVAKNQYTFDFKQLGQWIDLCLSLGIEYFEIPHFFTQWGSKHAPKFVARVGSRTKRIFGWETDALGEEYTAFLSQFIPALLHYLKQKGVDKKCFFHVSDEPKLNDIEHYQKCSALLKKHLGEDYPIIDALSDYDFYQSGALKKPVSFIPKSKPFLDTKVDGLWVYYCGETTGFTGRLHALPLARTRVLGIQLWRHNVEGFLHWGYNFYHSRNSYDYVNPFEESSAQFFAPAGDAFLVYPAHDGTALESLRLNAMREAMDDVRALDRLTELKGRDYVERIVAEEAGGKLPDFFDYPHDANFLLRLHDRIALEIENAI